jgi:hypothetical protein
VTFETLGLGGEQGVDETEQLHDTFVLTDIFVTLEDEIVRGAVAAKHCQLSWTLFG